MLVGTGHFLRPYSSQCDQHNGDQHHEDVLDRIETENFLADQIKINFGAHEVKHQTDQELGMRGYERKQVKLTVGLAALLPIGIGRENCRYQKSQHHITEARMGV